MTPADATAKIALVTGAARRIGRAIALDLGRQGWRVAVHYSGSAGDAQDLVGEIRASGSQAIALQADLAKIEELAPLISRCASEIGIVTCLVNNASVFLDDRFETLEPEAWDTNLSVNLRAPVFLAKAFAAALPAGAVGNVINIADQRVWRPTPQFFSYSLTKAALWAATRTMALALAPRIRVNAIGPGPVLRSIHQSADEFAQEQASTILGRGTTPEEIAAAVRFILDAPAMTGQMIALDGGQHLAWRTPDIVGWD